MTQHAAAGHCKSPAETLALFAKRNVSLVLGGGGAACDEECRCYERFTGRGSLPVDEGNMQKAIALFLLLIMAIQLLWPIGIPGLRRRRDFWKIAVFAIVMMMVTVLIRP